MNKEVFIDGCRVYVENGDVKIQLSDEIMKRGGDMTPETFESILLAEIRMIYALGGDNNGK